MKTNTENTKSEYDTQAEAFLSANGLKFRATLSDTKTPGWAKDGEAHGHHYRVTISRASRPAMKGAFDVFEDGKKVNTVFYSASANVDADEVKRSLVNHDGMSDGITVKAARATAGDRLVFDFWGSQNDAATGRQPSAYDVLACISSDAYTPETFEDFCAEYGYEADSIKALQTFRRADRFAKRLRAFFTEAELEALSEIR